MQNSFDFGRIEQRIKEAMLTLPVIVGNEAVNFALDNFRRQGFLGPNIEPWLQRKNRKKNKGRAILVQTGRLRNSIRIIKVTNNTVVIGTDVPYAKAHNEGFRGAVQVAEHSRNSYESHKIATGGFTMKGKPRMKTVQSIKKTGMVKAHTMKMNIPKRQFIGNSPFLDQRITRVIAAQLLKAVKY